MAGLIGGGGSVVTEIYDDLNLVSKTIVDQSDDLRYNVSPAGSLQNKSTRTWNENDADGGMIVSVSPKSYNPRLSGYIENTTSSGSYTSKLHLTFSHGTGTINLDNESGDRIDFNGPAHTLEEIETEYVFADSHDFYLKLESYGSNGGTIDSVTTEELE